MPDLIWMLNQLIDQKGQILIPGIMDSVAPLDEDEKKLYQEVDFCPNEFKSDAGVRSLRCPGNKVLCSQFFLQLCLCSYANTHNLFLFSTLRKPL